MGEKGKARRRSVPQTRLVCSVSFVDLFEGEEPCFAVALKYQFLLDWSSRSRTWVSRTSRVLVTHHEGGSTRTALAALTRVKVLPCLQ